MEFNNIYPSTINMVFICWPFLRHHYILFTTLEFKFEFE